jgi:hypothetical protein
MNFTELVDWSNLYRAFEKASKGKRSKPAVAMFEADLERQLFAIQAQLQLRELCSKVVYEGIRKAAYS